MTTLALSESSPTNTTLTDPYGTVVYEISTSRSSGDKITTIKRNGQIMAAVKWSTFGESKLTMGGMTAPLNDVFPKTSVLSDSRVFTTASGEKLKWKSKTKLECTSPDSVIPLATYSYRSFAEMRGKKSTLDISPNGVHLMDIIVVTWMISERKAQDRAIAEGVSSGVEAVVSAS